MEAKHTWYIHPELRAQVQLQPEQRYAIVPSGDEDKRKVLMHYAHGPVPGYEVASVDVIVNPRFDRAFDLELQRLQEKADNPAFEPKLSELPGIEQREAVLKQWDRLTQPYQDAHYNAVKLLPAWHGTRTPLLDSIFRVGYSNLSTTDEGFFGKGLYSAYEAEYAYRVYSQGALILNWVASFSALPVIDGDMGRLSGKANYGNYDAHFVPVVPRNPNDQQETVYYPCQPGQTTQYHELVVFQTSACLPRYLVHLQKTLIPGPTGSVLTTLKSKPALSWAEAFDMAAQILFEPSENTLHLWFPLPAQTYWTLWHEQMTELFKQLPPLDKQGHWQQRTPDDRVQILSLPMTSQLKSVYEVLPQDKRAAVFPVDKDRWITIQTHGRFFQASPHEQVYRQLVIALQMGAKQKVTTLLAQNSVPLIAYQDDKHNGFLHLLAQTSLVDFLESFLQMGFRLTDTNHFGDNPLHYACGQENKVHDEQGQMVQSLLALGSPIDTVNKQQQTPLMVAAQSGHLSAARALIEAGASLTLVDQYGQTALQLAQSSGLPEREAMLSLLRGQDRSPNCLIQ